MNNCAILDSQASRLASLLLAYIRPVCALVVPRHAGASTPRTDTLIPGRILRGGLPLGLGLQDGLADYLPGVVAGQCSGVSESPDANTDCGDANGCVLD